MHHSGRGINSGDGHQPVAQRGTQCGVGSDAAADRHRGDLVLGGGRDRLGDEGVDDRLLEGGRQPVDGDRLPAVTVARDLAQHGGLQARKREVVAALRPGSRKARRRAGPGGGGADRRTPRIRQSQQPSHLVEGLARRVVDGLAEQCIAPVVAHQDELGMSAADHEAEQRERRLRGEWLGGGGIGQPVGIDVALDVVHANQRQVVRHGKRLRHVDAHQQRADEPRPVGDRHGVEIAPVDLRVLHGRTQGRNDPAQLLPCCHLGDDPPGGSVDRHLAGDGVRANAAAPADHRHACLVAGRLDGQDERRAHSAMSSRSRARIARIRGPARAGVVMISASSPSSV